MKKTTTAKTATMALAAVMCAGAGLAMQVTKDLGHGVKVYEGNGERRISFDDGKTWITTISRSDNNKNDLSGKDGYGLDYDDRLSLNNSDAEKMVRDDPFAEYGIPCRNRVFAVIDGSAKKLDSGKRKGDFVSLKPKGKAGTYVSGDGEYVKYIWLEKVNLTVLLRMVERYYRTEEFKGAFSKTSQGVYGVFEIMQPIEVMRLRHNPNAELSGNEFSVDYQRRHKLRRGVLVDAGTFVGMIESLGEEGRKNAAAKLGLSK